MVFDLLVAVVVVVVVFQAFEHVVIPLFVRRALREKAALTGIEGLIDREVEVRNWSGRSGVVFVKGELWQAEGPPSLHSGDLATVVRVENLTLVVVPAVPAAPEEG